MCKIGFMPDKDGNCVEIINLLEEEDFRFLEQLDLTDAQENWINDLKNKQAKDAITKYLSSFILTAEFDKAKIFVKEAIIALMDTTNFINTFEEFETYSCSCNCSGTETKFTDDLANNMEPKWGQLANKQEILDEIKDLNFNNLTFKKQIILLANHFEKHLKYTRVNGELKIVDTTTDVNRYIYSEVGGWIDFHHVFKIFEWATENGPFSAITKGELGEMWQSLKNNNSAYSYEDLPSNLLGIGMYLRFSQDIALDNISWYQAIEISLNEISCIEPEEAPNFDYIPHIINEFYPKNYTYTPLLGDDLKKYHKLKFCERTTKEQKNIKEAHEKFPR